MIQQIPDPPLRETGARDTVEVAVSGALGLVPGVGTWLAAGVQKTFAQQEQLRMNVYLKELVAVVNALVDAVEGLTPEVLAGTPSFYDAAVRAARAALASTSVQKHRALQNALFNVGADRSTDTDLHAAFLRALDELTDTHIQILRQFGTAEGTYLQPEQWAGGLDVESRARTFLNDLVSRGFVVERDIFTRNARGMAIYGGAIEGGHRISAVGVEFLSFIAGPFGTGPRDDT